MTAFLCILLISVAGLAAAENEDDKPDKTAMNPGTFAGLKLRGIGPALQSGRIGDIAVHPTDRSVWYVAVASGGVWKTTNAGTTWKPIFDKQGSYSIGCLAMDPVDPRVVWIGTGENNSQRSVGFGDGIYKSLDGGRTWKRKGLENSEHIAKILIDPRNTDVVYVAAQGPLWAPGGERGLFKTTDGGETFAPVLTISENTGVTDAAFDPRDPDIIYAASYQRRRHVWTLIDGGPESALHKSCDGGATWEKIGKGLPGGDLGRIGIAVSLIDPDVVYALVEAAGKDGGFYRSRDGGLNFERRSSYVATSPQYYQEICADPHRFDCVYSLDTSLMFTEDGGKTFKAKSHKAKHVDNHALVFDPIDPDYLLVGCDGGLYESFDCGATWDFKANLPVTQFYRVAVDNDFPFYNVYGGTQDNGTQGGPSRTRLRHGISNREWIITHGGDGFEPQVDPDNPDIVYSQSQHGVLARYDRGTGDRTSIQPQAWEEGEALRWNWDSPLLISPHSSQRLYFAAQKLFRSDDRGDSWTAISGDLSRNLDRNSLEVMGRIFSIDAVAKHWNTSYYGNVVSLSESPCREGLIYAGTDDGLIQATVDGGANWTRLESFPGIPDRTYVADIEASRHAEGTVFAAFNNHKMGDFKPYLLRSTDRGRTWTSMAGDLPERGPVWSIVEDHVDPDLLFAGTEFGLFFTVNGGKQWIRLNGNVPVIPFRDLEIQRRENDLVAATFGRGFYILDDYTPLRFVSEELLEQEAELFPVRKAWMYIPESPLGGRTKGPQGDSFYVAPNPPFGAVFTYYLKEGLKSRKQQRKEAEKKALKDGETIAIPSWDELRREDREEKPTVLLTIRDEEGIVIRRIDGPSGKGFHRVAWDLRHPASTPAVKRDSSSSRGGRRSGSGPMVLPGTYSVCLEKMVDGQSTPLGESRTFEAAPLVSTVLTASDRAALHAFQKKTARLQRAALGVNKAAVEVKDRLAYIKEALRSTPGTHTMLMDRVRSLELRLEQIQIRLTGDAAIRRRKEPTPPAVLSRVQRAVSNQWSSLSGPTQTDRQSFEIASKELEEIVTRLTFLVEHDLAPLEEALEKAGAPWTPGRIPRWKHE